MVTLEDLVGNIYDIKQKKPGYGGSETSIHDLSSNYIVPTNGDDFMQQKPSSLNKILDGDFDNYSLERKIISQSPNIYNKSSLKDKLISYTNNINIIKETKSDLSTIISHQKYQNDEGKIYSLLDSYVSNNKKLNYSDMIHDLSDLGYETVSSTRAKPGATSDKPLAANVAIPEVHGVFVPDEYRPLMAELSKQYPGLVFTGSTVMANASQHEVELLTFSYVAHGKTHELTVVAKDRLPTEELVARGLAGVGINTYGVFSGTDRKLLMEHLGRQTVGDAIKFGSHTDAERAMNLAVSSLAELHVLATTHLPELAHDFGVRVPTIDYTQQFQERFLLPVGGGVLSPEAVALLDAYKTFAQIGNNYFVHGDAHKENFVLRGGEAAMIDFEWVGLGDRLMDLARFTNDVVRSRHDVDPEEVAYHMLLGYRDEHNHFADEHGGIPLTRSVQLPSAFSLALINDELYKVGEYVTFGALHPHLEEEKLHKSRGALVRTLDLLDQAAPYHGAAVGNLKQALVNFVATSPVKELKDTVTVSEKPLLYVA